jgi:hypothetical protein
MDPIQNSYTLQALDTLYAALDTSKSLTKAQVRESTTFKVRDSLESYLNAYNNFSQNPDVTPAQMPAIVIQTGTDSFTHQPALEARVVQPENLIQFPVYQSAVTPTTYSANGPKNPTGTQPGQPGTVHTTVHTTVYAPAAKPKRVRNKKVPSATSAPKSPATLETVAQSSPQESDTVSEQKTHYWRNVFNTAGKYLQNAKNKTVAQAKKFGTYVQESKPVQYIKEQIHTMKTDEQTKNSAKRTMIVGALALGLGYIASQAIPAYLNRKTDEQAKEFQRKVDVDYKIAAMQTQLAQIKDKKVEFVPQVVQATPVYYADFKPVPARFGEILDFKVGSFATLLENRVKQSPAPEQVRRSTYMPIAMPTYAQTQNTNGVLAPKATPQEVQEYYLNNRPVTAIAENGMSITTVAPEVDATTVTKAQLEAHQNATQELVKQGGN